MKKLTVIALCLAMIVSLCACGGKSKADPAYPTFKYTQYASGGVKSELDAIILFENYNSTFTRYQVAYTSCTCRDAATNYRSVMYVEILNTKATPAEASIRAIGFGEKGGFNVGLWGDSDPIYGHPDYTHEYMDENFVQKYVGVTKADLDSWDGYGKQLDVVDVDAVSGATVSTSNMTSVLKSLFEYHCNKYYSGK